MRDKALLVMDMPNCCTKCGFFFYLDEYAAYCEKVTDPDDSESLRAIKEDYYQCKPDWCPLKPVPEKKEALEVPKIPSLIDFRRKGFKDGWNACIDKILEGCKDETD